MKRNLAIFLTVLTFFCFIRKAEAQNFLEKSFVIGFTDNANNQVAYINIPKALPVFGTMEVQITGGYNSELNRGVLTKNIDIVYQGWPDSFLDQKSEISNARDPLANQWHIGDFNPATSQIPIYHLVSSGNEINVKIKVHLINAGTIDAFKTGLTVSQPTTYSNGPVRSYKHFNDSKIGIGTSSPEHRLDIVGTLRAHEILVNTQKTADFVFESDYDLQNLDVVKDYVKKNKHLPGIQSAKEMEKDGINVGQFQIDLLQKIEELTLHLIEKNEEIKALHSEVNDLKSDVMDLKKQRK